MAEKLFRAAHEGRAKGNRNGFLVDAALATSMGLLPDSFRALMRDAGFRQGEAKPLAEGMFGPPRPLLWTWRAPRRDAMQPPPRERTQRTERKAPRGDRPPKQQPGKCKPERRDDRREKSPVAGPATGKALAGLAELFGKTS